MDELTLWSIAAMVAGLFFVLIGFVSGPFIRPDRLPIKTMIVLGSGGHTSEMLTIISSMDKTIYTPRIYVISESDTLSQQKLRDSAEKDRTDYFMETIQRPREVGQNWISSLLYTTPQTFYQCRGLIKEYRPNLVLCNGPGICVPVCVVAKFYKQFFRLRCAIMYVESICRVRRLSLTGRMLLRIADFFFVQWPELHREGRTLYIGRIS